MPVRVRRQLTEQEFGRFRDVRRQTPGPRLFPEQRADPADTSRGSQIKLWRTEAGVGREALAKEAGYDYEYVKSMENGRRRPTLRLLPIDGAHPGLNGPMVLLETAEHEHFGYEEGQTTGVLYSDPDRVSIATQRHAMILRQALSLSESASLISKVAEGQ
ncbi:Scr1 family TA system antitoxin-like transcriptional regulator [Streptomyces sp. NPDC048508]|uniref:Scr1 family TA system antitoxin-like transcriptional regulator n=1 Tax=Streptomyces sp. NPDC048508 TaxID=3365561 RepID=UPI00371FB1A3